MLARSDKQTFPWHQGHLVKFWHGLWQQVTSFPRNSPKCNTQADKINSYSKQKSFCPTLVTLSVTASWSFQFGPIRCGQVQETVFFVLGFQRETRKAFLQILLSFPVTELKTEAQKKCFEVRTQIHLESLALSLKLVNEIGNHRCRRMKTKNVPENTRFGKKNMYGMAKHLSAQREKNTQTRTEELGLRTRQVFREDPHEQRLQNGDEEQQVRAPLGAARRVGLLRRFGQDLHLQRANLRCGHRNQKKWQPGLFNLSLEAKERLTSCSNQPVSMDTPKKLATVQFYRIS